jgi:acetyl esterase/lipase
VYRAARPNGAALLIIPGGAYGIELLDREGIETARVFNRAGITCFILRYRLPGDGWAGGADVPLQDAQRAMRLIRAHAVQYSIDSRQIGVVGFSAGGHLAASLATRFTAEVYPHRDAVDAGDAKPTVVVLLFPIITMGDGTDPGTRANLLGKNPSPEAILAYSCDKHVSPGTPPSFVCFAADDPVAPPLANGMAMYQALRAAGVASELHVFEQGGHGFGVWNAAGKPFAAWPQLFLQWAAGHHFTAITPAQASHIGL